MQTFLFKVTCENYKVHRNNLINLTISLSLHRGGFKVLISSRVTTIHQTVIGETNTKTLFISKKHILVNCFSAVILLLKRSRKILFWSKQSQSFRRWFSPMIGTLNENVCNSIKNRWYSGIAFMCLEDKLQFVQSRQTTENVKTIN